MVGSLAMIIVSRPCTRPIPATSPAPCTSPSYMPKAARAPISRNGAPGSISRATRSRARSLPRPTCRSRALAEPPSAAARRRAVSSSISARQPATLAASFSVCSPNPLFNFVISPASPGSVSSISPTAPPFSTSMSVYVDSKPVAIQITLPRGIAQFDCRRRRPGGVDLGVVDVAQALVVDPDDVLILMSEPDVVSGEHAPRVHRLARGFVEADDADDEVDLARRERLLVHAKQRTVGLDRVEQGPAQRQRRVFRLDEPHRLEAHSPSALLRHARADHPGLGGRLADEVGARVGHAEHQGRHAVVRGDDGVAGENDPRAGAGNARENEA